MTQLKKNYYNAEEMDKDANCMLWKSDIQRPASEESTSSNNQIFPELI